VLNRVFNQVANGALEKDAVEIELQVIGSGNTERQARFFGVQAEIVTDFVELDRHIQRFLPGGRIVIVGPREEEEPIDQFLHAAAFLQSRGEDVSIFFFGPGSQQGDFHFTTQHGHGGAQLVGDIAGKLRQARE